MMFLGSPSATPLVIKYYKWRQRMVVAGFTLCVISQIRASFTSSIAILVASQDALYGTGVLVVYASLVSLVNEWFIQRRGLAYGIMFAGGGVSGAGLLFLEWPLVKHGYQSHHLRESCC
ncbi:hypothetical protein BJ878DRAFT_525699 [Calycina marina]|uniref:Monocarboxylate transporter n=1 Tax=Calycina marina TaxID=1763456 RepID=A0A9P8CCR6_9HELO|nr:hypothetical protein BJ878DRAFT_525699 [Calycina marina]